MNICNCNEVSYKEIEKFVKKYPNATIQLLREHTGASTGCGRCRSLIEKTFQELKEKLPQNNQLRLSF